AGPEHGKRVRRAPGRRRGRTIARSSRAGIESNARPSARERRRLRAGAGSRGNGGFARVITPRRARSPPPVRLEPSARRGSSGRRFTQSSSEGALRATTHKVHADGADTPAAGVVSKPGASGLPDLHARPGGPCMRSDLPDAEGDLGAIGFGRSPIFFPPGSAAV